MQEITSTRIRIRTNKSTRRSNIKTPATEQITITHLGNAHKLSEDVSSRGDAVASKHFCWYPLTPLWNEKI